MKHTNWTHACHEAMHMYDRYSIQCPSATFNQLLKSKLFAIIGLKSLGRKFSNRLFEAPGAECRSRGFGVSLLTAWEGLLARVDGWCIGYGVSSVSGKVRALRHYFISDTWEIGSAHYVHFATDIWFFGVVMSLCRGLFSYVHVHSNWCDYQELFFGYWHTIDGVAKLLWSRGGYLAKLRARGQIGRTLTESFTGDFLVMHS